MQATLYAKQFCKTTGFHQLELISSSQFKVLKAAILGGSFRIGTERYFEYHSDGCSDLSEFLALTHSRLNVISVHCLCARDAALSVHSYSIVV